MTQNLSRKGVRTTSDPVDLFTPLSAIVFPLVALDPAYSSLLSQVVQFASMLAEADQRSLNRFETLLDLLLDKQKSGDSEPELLASLEPYLAFRDDDQVA